MNKPRLIDANKLYKLIEENSYTLVDRINSKEKGMFLVGIKEAIDKTPTAYDIDKVVEQLEELKNENGALGEMDWYAGLAQGFHEAIEIVKGGGNE